MCALYSQEKVLFPVLAMDPDDLFTLRQEFYVGNFQVGLRVPRGWVV
jgi:hypothetical protein